MVEVNFLEQLETLREDLESVSERAISAEGRAFDNGKLINQLKQIDDGQQNALTKIEEKLITGKEAIEALRNLIGEQQAINQEQHNSIADLNRRLASVIDRMDGKGFLLQEPYERIVATVREQSEQLRGGEGQLSFSQIRNSIQQTQFLGKTIYGAIGIFGVSGVVAAGLALFGSDKVPPELKALQEKVADVRTDLDKLQSNWEADIRHRLERKKD